MQKGITATFKQMIHGCIDTIGTKTKGLKMKKKIEYFRWECVTCKCKGKFINVTAGDAAREGLTSHNKHRSDIIVQTSNGKYIGVAAGINFHVTR